MSVVTNKHSQEEIFYSEKEDQNKSLIEKEVEGQNEQEIIKALDQLHFILQKSSGRESGYGQGQKQSFMAYRQSNNYTMSIFPGNVLSSKNRLVNKTLKERLLINGVNQDWKSMTVENQNIITERCDYGVITLMRSILIGILIILFLFLLNSYWAFQQLFFPCKKNCYTTVYGGYGILDFSNGPPIYARYVTLISWMILSYLFQMDAKNNPSIDLKVQAKKQSKCTEVIIKNFKNNQSKEEIQQIFSNKLNKCMNRLNVTIDYDINKLTEIQKVIPINNYLLISKYAKKANVLFMEILTQAKEYEQQCIQSEKEISYHTLIFHNQSLRKKLITYINTCQQLQKENSNLSSSKYIIRFSLPLQRQLICQILRPTSYFNGVISTFKFLMEKEQKEEEDESQRAEYIQVYSRDINWKTAGIPPLVKMKRRLVVGVIGFFQFFISAFILILIDVLKTGKEEQKDSGIYYFLEKVMFMVSFSLFYLINEKIYEMYGKYMVSSYYSYKIRQHLQDLFFFNAITYLIIPLAVLQSGSNEALISRNEHPEKDPFDFLKVPPWEYFTSFATTGILFFALKLKWMWSVLVQKYYERKDKFISKTQCQLNKIFKKRKFAIKNCSMAFYNIMLMSVPFTYCQPSILLFILAVLIIQYTVFKYQFICVFRPSFFAQYLHRSPKLRIYISAANLMFFCLFAENNSQVYGGISVVSAFNLGTAVWVRYGKSKTKSLSPNESQLKFSLKCLIQQKNLQQARNECQELTIVNKVVDIDNQNGQLNENEKEDYSNDDSTLSLEKAYLKFQMNLNDLINFHIGSEYQ